MGESQGWTGENSPFHSGEVGVQERIGVRDRAERLGRRMIRNFLPEQHRDFYRQLPFLIVGSVDTHGRPWASLIAGPPGFISTPDAQTLSINAQPLFGSPLAEQATPGAAIGILGILPEERRRNRATGQLIQRDDDSLTIAVDQTFGNCPQYIQSRTIEALPTLATPGTPRPIDEGGSLEDTLDGSLEDTQDGALEDTFAGKLDERARRLIETADTFFIATAHGDRDQGAELGADVSHRGGRPGFVRVDEDSAVTFPDFRGNNHFNTLGNIAESGRAGVMFIDFDSGDLLYLSGDAEIIWDGEEVDTFAGAQRLVRIRPQRWRRVSSSLPLRFHFDSYAPRMEALGTWAEAASP